MSFAGAARFDGDNCSSTLERMEMPTFRNKTYGEQDELNVDGAEFYDCKFVETRLVYSGGDLPKFSNCELDSCEFSLTAAAARTVTYLRFLDHIGAGAVVDAVFKEIRPEVRDGG